MAKSHQTPICFRTFGLGVLCFFGVLVLASVAAHAHRVHIYAFAEGKIIHTESKFVGGGPVKDGKIIVQDAASDQVLLTGQSDALGNFSFPVPSEAASRKLNLKIIIEASMGHQGEWLLKASNYLPSDASDLQPPAAAETGGALPTPQSASSAVGVGFDRQVLEDVVNQALEKQLTPVKQMLTEAQDRRPSLTDILGGIGYILGLCGVAAYLKSRKGPEGS